MAVATPNPAEFEAAVRAYLAPSRGQFNHDQMLLTFLSVDRFRQWAGVVSSIQSLERARFLSSGCGFGGSLLAYRDAGAALAVGVEVDDDYLRFAALRVAALDGAGAVAYDGRRLPFPDAAFDVIESMDVIEHTPDPLAYLLELRRVLAPNGVILLVTPNRLWPVEQHLGIVGPPWLPVGLGDALFAVLARLPLLSADRRFRYSKLRGMRTQHISVRSLRASAAAAGLSLDLLDPADHPDWPLPRHHRMLERLSRAPRVGRLAPIRTLAGVLRVSQGEAGRAEPGSSGHR
ncbi:MAG TPA: class I SAM-dependent methyltransferase [Egibacteraceae bacterium]|nr:class I SAM-dependent methyltransferase [Egibacteraceae bacterium]